MTIDEAIKHCEEVAEEQNELCKRCDRASGYSRSHNESIRTNDAKKHEKCGQEHIQLAGWLKELKALKAEPCEDAISRNAAIMCMTGVNLLSKKPEELISLFDRRIKALPSVTPKQKTGHWIKEFNDTEGEVRFTCSNCGKHQLFETDYCYHCGSDNRKGQE